MRDWTRALGRLIVAAIVLRHHRKQLAFTTAHCIRLRNELDLARRDADAIEKRVMAAHQRVTTARLDFRFPRPAKIRR